MSCGAVLMLLRAKRGSFESLFLFVRCFGRFSFIDENLLYLSAFLIGKVFHGSDFGLEWATHEVEMSLVRHLMIEEIQALLKAQAPTTRDGIRDRNDLPLLRWGTARV